MTIPYFGLVNFRMIAVPSLAMDYYNSFFFTHPVTHFCQIRFLKPFVACPYQEQLAIVIYNAFGIGGQFNASLFATEEIASVGAFFAPVTALVSGLVIALGNRLSAGLQPQFILISGAVIIQALLNVPLSTVLLSHGCAILFLLWYITREFIWFGSERAEGLNLCAASREYRARGSAAWRRMAELLPSKGLHCSSKRIGKIRRKGSHAVVLARKLDFELLKGRLNPAKHA